MKTKAAFIKFKLCEIKNKYRYK